MSREVVMENYVRKNPDRPRYELVESDDVVAIADYREVGDRLVIHHTEVARPLRGSGKGAQLVKGVLDSARAEGKTVVPQCWFVAEFIDLNPEYADLLAS
jgi:predicted GNAT family acetyltransferase